MPRRAAFRGADTGQYNYLFRGGVRPSYYSDIQWGGIQPRFGIAYNFGKNVIRAGGGRYITRLGVSDSVFLGGNPPFQPIASVSNGSVDNPGGGSQNLFPLAPTSQSGTFKNPEAWSYNVMVERETFWNSLISVGYVGRVGLHLQQERDINQLQAGTLTGCSPNCANTDYLRQYKGYGVIRETDNVARSKYDSFQVNWTRRFTGGFAFGVAYTYSYSYDNGSAQRDIIPYAYDRSWLWGPSDYDTRHIAVINYIYDLPFFRNATSLAGKLVGGWQLSGLTPVPDRHTLHSRVQPGHRWRRHAGQHGLPERATGRRQWRS